MDYGGDVARMVLAQVKVKFKVAAKTAPLKHGESR